MYSDRMNDNVNVNICRLYIKKILVQIFFNICSFNCVDFMIFMDSVNGKKKVVCYFRLIEKKLKYLL